MSTADRIAALRAEADRLESKTCTGVSASWCPVHGDCNCLDWRMYNDPRCPLHSMASRHAERGTDR